MTSDPAQHTAAMPTKLISSELGHVRQRDFPLQFSTCNEVVTLFYFMKLDTPFTLFIIALFLSEFVHEKNNIILHSTSE